jgi:hypothetical protein
VKTGQKFSGNICDMLKFLKVGSRGTNRHTNVLRYDLNVNAPAVLR